jgi:chromosome segregation ATPase
VKAENPKNRGELGGVKADRGRLEAELAGMKADFGRVKADFGRVKAERNQAASRVAELAGELTQAQASAVNLAGQLEDARGSSGDPRPRLAARTVEFREFRATADPCLKSLQRGLDEAKESARHGAVAMRIVEGLQREYGHGYLKEFS